MGLADYLGWGWKSKAGMSDRERAGMSRTTRQLHGDALVPALQVAAGLAPMIPLDDAGAALHGSFGKTVHEGCDRAEATMNRAISRPNMVRRNAS